MNEDVFTLNDLRNESKFNAALKSFIEYAECTKNELREYLSCDASSITRWTKLKGEQGRRVPKEETRSRIALFFHMKEIFEVPAVQQFIMSDLDTGGIIPTKNPNESNQSV